MPVCDAVPASGHLCSSKTSCLLAAVGAQSFCCTAAAATPAMCGDQGNLPSPMQLPPPLKHTHTHIHTVLLHCLLVPVHSMHIHFWLPTCAHAMIKLLYVMTLGCSPSSSISPNIFSAVSQLPVRSQELISAEKVITERSQPLLRISWYVSRTCAPTEARVS